MACVNAKPGESGCSACFYTETISWWSAPGLCTACALVKCRHRHSLKLLGPTLLWANNFCSLEPKQRGSTLAKVKAQFKNMCQHLQGLKKDICREQSAIFFTRFCWALIKEAFSPLSATWAVGLQPLLAWRGISLVHGLIRKDSHCSPASWKIRTKAAAGRLQFCLHSRGSGVKENGKLLNRKAFWCCERN